MKPTLLALHGSGSNATVHTVQMARLMRYLRPHFEVESLEAPFPSPAGPGVLPFFDGCGPFKRWLPTTAKISVEAMRNGTATATLSEEVEDLIKSTVLRIQSKGGKVVGLIGFSQGTKIVAGLLRASEFREEFDIKGEDWCDFKMALSVCGTYPPYMFPLSIANKLPEGTDYTEGKIKIPTFHVQGKEDEWMWAGQALIDRNFKVGSEHSRVVEWDMGHHYPASLEQSEILADWMVDVLKKSEGENHPW